MTIKEIFTLAICLGEENDFRPKALIRRRLKKIAESYEKLPDAEKKLFDREKMKNPYMDSHIHFSDDKSRKVKRVLAGIDVEGAEILTAYELSEKSPKKPIDLVIAHHPVGKSLIGLDGVMDLQVDVFEQYGIPVNVAEGLLKKRISEVSRGVNPINHFQAVDTARLLGVNFMNVHTPSDNMVAQFLKRLIEEKKPEYVGEIMDALLEISEYQEAVRQGIGPCLFAGHRENRAGRIAITEITGGTEGSPGIYEHMAHAGIGTVIAMHQSEKHRTAAEKAHINVVVAGHISSDSIGMNLFLDELEKRGVEITPFSGLIRHSRVEK